MLVIIGATPEGKKELVGFQVGLRESAQSWRELPVDLKARGLAMAPELATGDGALGFWKALEKVSPTTRHQRRAVHETVNVLDKLPKSVRPAAKADVREVWTTPAVRRPKQPECREIASVVIFGTTRPHMGLVRGARLPGTKIAGPAPSISTALGGAPENRRPGISARAKSSRGISEMSS